MGTEGLMRCVIISAGDMCSIEDYKYLDGSSFSIMEDDFVICADGGYSHAQRLNITPNIIVGDMDSYEGALPKDIDFMGFDSVKDDTDTMLAIKLGFERGYKEFVLLGALGGRLDHSFANLQSLCYIIERCGTGYILDSANSITILKNTKSIVKPREGFALSVFSYSDICTGVYLRGLKYPLTNATVTRSFPIGVSNKFTEQVAEVEVMNGTLLVMVCKL